MPNQMPVTANPTCHLSNTAVALVSECEVKEYQDANLSVEWTTIRRPSNLYPKPGGAS
jgi:hypothetical protein